MPTTATTLDKIPSVIEETSFTTEPPTEFDEELGFEEPEVEALAEIEAELVEDEETLEREMFKELGITAVSQDDIEGFWASEDEAMLRIDELDEEAEFGSLDVLKLYFRDVIRYQYRVNKTVERKLIKIYTNLRGGDCKVDSSDLELPEHIANYIFSTNKKESTPEEMEKKIEEVILTSNAKLISRMAYSKSRGGIPMEDLIGDAATGFLRGLRKYDITKTNPATGKPYELSTYVTWWLRQATDLGVISQKREMRFKAPLRRRIQEYYKTFYYLQGKLGDEPSSEELAKELDVPISYIEDIKNSIESSAILSLDNDFDNDGEGCEDGNSLLDVIKGETDIEGQFIQSNLHETMQGFLNQCLQLRERNILLMRFRIAPYDNPGKTVEQVDDILTKHFSSKNIGKPKMGGHGRLVYESKPIRYVVENKITKRWAAEYEGSDGVVGITLLESDDKDALGIPEIMELVKQFAYDDNGNLREFLRVVEAEKSGTDGTKLLEVSIHFDNGKGATLKEIGRELDISRERVRQLQDAAINKMVDYCYKQGIDYMGCGILPDDKNGGTELNHERWSKNPEKVSFTQSYVTEKAYWEIERDQELAKKKKSKTPETICKIAPEVPTYYDCKITDIFDTAELKVGMYVQNLRKELISKRGKDGKPECTFTGKLIPYRVWTITEIRDITVVIQLEGSDEKATVMKEYLRPVAPKKKR